MILGSDSNDPRWKSILKEEIHQLRSDFNFKKDFNLRKILILDIYMKHCQIEIHLLKKNHCLPIILTNIKKLFK